MSNSPLCFAGRIAAAMSFSLLLSLGLSIAGAADPYRAHDEHEHPTEVWLRASADETVVAAFGRRVAEVIAGGAPFEGQVRFESENELKRWGGALATEGAADGPVIEMRDDGGAAVFRAFEPGAVSERTYTLRHLLSGQNDRSGSVTLTTPTLRLRTLVRIAPAPPTEGDPRNEDDPRNEGAFAKTMRLFDEDGAPIVSLGATASGALRLELTGAEPKESQATLAFGEWHELELDFEAAAGLEESGDLSVLVNGVEVADLRLEAHGVGHSVRAFAIGASCGDAMPGVAVECRWIRWSHRDAAPLVYDADLIVAHVRDVSATEARVLVIQDPAAFGWSGVEAFIEYGPDARATPAQALLGEEGHAGAFHLTGLAPGTECAYRVELRDPDGEGAWSSGAYSFRTLPVEPAVVRVGWFSCHEQSAQSHPFDVYAAVASRGVDFIVNVGDFHYNDSQPAFPYPGSRAEIMDSVRDVLLDLPYAAAAKSIPMFIMLDDHDVWANNATIAWADSEDVLDEHGGVTKSHLWHEGLAALEFLFRRAMLNTGSEADSFRSWETARTLYVMLDTRTYQRRGAQTMLGLEQRDWLLGVLAATDKPNLVIFSPSVWGDVQDGRDNWEGGGTHTAFHAERQMIVDAIEASGAIERAIVLSGDRHCSMIHTRTGSEKILFEACAGPASNNVFTQYSVEDAALPGVVFCSTDGAQFPPLVTPPEYAHMAGRLVIDEITGAFTVEILDADDGRVMHSYTPGVSAPTSGDVNGDGHVNFEDLNAVLGAWGAQGENLAQDVNGDGTVDFADLNVVLSAFNTAL